MSTRARGRWAEQLARAHLERRGLVPVAENVRGPRGEIDLVMRDGETIVFVEVRYRGPGAWVDGAESIDARKRDRLIATARYWLGRCGAGTPPACRFDVIAVSGRDRSPRVRWVRDAFDA